MKIRIHQVYDFLVNRYDFEFIIDSNKKVIIPIRIPKHEKEYDSIEEVKQYNKFCVNVLIDELNLDDFKLDKFLKEFFYLNLTTKNEIDEFIGDFYNFTEIEIQTKNNIFHNRVYKIYPKDWFRFAKLLHELVGFDILNIKNLKYKISNLHFNFCKDGIYDKYSGKKLKLNSIEFLHSDEELAIVNPHLMYLFINFKEKSLIIETEKEWEWKRNIELVELQSYNNQFKNNLTEEKIIKIQELLEEYYVYKWISEDLWEKTKQHNNLRFDGPSWSLSLEFEGGYHLYINSPYYPDTYVHLGRKIIELLGKDVFRLCAFDSTELSLYEKYGDKYFKNNI